MLISSSSYCIAKWQDPALTTQCACKVDVRVSSQKIRFTLLEIAFAKLFLHVSGDDECVGKQRVARVTIADHGSSHSEGAKVDLTTPVALYKELSAKYVTYYLMMTW